MRKSSHPSPRRQENAGVGPLLLSLLALAWVPCLSLACESAPAVGSLAEWKPADHHSSDDDKLGQEGPSARQAQGARQPTGSDVPQLVDLAWRQQCTNCHGPLGKGDGQMGPMLQAPDLTRDDLQSRMTDAEMAALIKRGKDKMPAFNLPDPVVQGLVARIRQIRAR
jgi:mono/diheme cytochrome c family protein